VATNSQGHFVDVAWDGRFLSAAIREAQTYRRAGHAARSDAADPADKAVVRQRFCEDGVQEIGYPCWNKLRDELQTPNWTVKFGGPSPCPSPHPCP
jgi:hypothetical protein